MAPRFRVLFLEAATLFLDRLEEKPREKILYNIRKAQIVNDTVLFKKLNKEIWEFRTLYKETHYRLYAFWDRSNYADSVVIATHGIVKKSDKAKPRDLDRAESLRRGYFSQNG